MDYFTRAFGTQGSMEIEAREAEFEILWIGFASF
jgi:hypothetical protein